MVNNEIFLGSGASTTFIPEQDIFIPVDGTGGSATSLTVTPDTAFSAVFKFVPNIYIGSNIDIFDASNNLLSSHTVASNATGTITLATAVGTGTPAYALLRAYGSPSPHPEVSGRQCLLADNFLGLMESVTFPNLSQEIKQMNLGLGGTRNFSFQYKGIRTADNGSLALVANTGSWLYYAFGAMDAITFGRKTHLTITYPADNGPPTGTADAIYIEGTNANPTDGVAIVTETGPHFYRTVKGGTTLVPPVDFTIFPDSNANNQTVDFDTDGRPKNITYTIKELNTDQLPSFSLEQSMAKDPASLTTNANIGASPSPLDESNNFVRIARGCRVNSLTIEASEGEELKMNMDLNARLVDSISDLYASASLQTNYISRAGQTDNANLFNFNAGTAHASPFFFSQGTFSAFGQQFLKVNSVSIAINNNLLDKRYMGGHRDMKEGIPAQRSYEITFEAVVTDDLLFKEMLNETENTTANRVVFTFTKPDTNESITLEFKDYFLDTTEITIPDDKGPVTFSSTIKPRNLHSCVVVSDYVLLG